MKYLLFLIVLVLFSCSKNNIEPSKQVSKTPIQHDTALAHTWVLDSFYNNNNGKMLYSTTKPGVGYIGWDTTILNINGNGIMYTTGEANGSTGTWRTSNDSIYIVSNLGLFTWIGTSQYSIKGNNLKLQAMSNVWAYDTWNYYHKK